MVQFDIRNQNSQQKIFIMKWLVTFSLCTLFYMYGYSQDYHQALGFRTGYASGIVYKNFFTDEKAVQLMACFQRGGTQIYFLRQYYHPVFLDHTQQVFFYYGAGAHLGYSKWSGESELISGEVYKRKEFSFGVGIDANLGIEYRILKFPLVICIDYKPFYEINIPLYIRKHYYNFAVTLAYTF